MEHKKIKDRIDALTGVRFWMIMIIVLSHLTCLRGEYPYSAFYNQYLHNATLGVDFFFMLSGFGMMYSYGENNVPVSIRGGYYFAVNRIKKIYPIYIASLMVCIPYDFIRSLGIGHTTMETIRNIFIKIAFCVTLLQSVAGIEALDRGLNNVCWFLSSLFMIYIISPYMISMINKVKDKWISIIFAGTICATMLIFYFFTSIQEVTFFDDLNYGSPYFRIMFVIMGMLLEKIYEHIKDNIRKYRCFEYLAAVGAVVWFFYRNKSKEYLYACRLIDILLCAFLLLTIASGNGKVAYFLSRKQSVMLGNMSMYIFIIHFPIILYLDYLFDRSNIRVFLNDATGIVEAILIIVSTGVIVRIMMERKKEGR